MNDKFKKFIMAVLVIVIVASFAGCGSEAAEPETATVPFDSVTESIAEPGVYYYQSSHKTIDAFEEAASSENTGYVAATLKDLGGKEFVHTATWWTPVTLSGIHPDMVVVAGASESSYSFSVNCFKCNFAEHFEGKIGGADAIRVYTCDCINRNLSNCKSSNKRVIIVELPLAN